MKLTNPIGGRLRLSDNGVLIDADQLPSPFERTSVDEHPLHVLWLSVQDDLADGVERRREIDGPGSRMIASAFFPTVSEPIRSDIFSSVAPSTVAMRSAWVTGPTPIARCRADCA
jgi:hypothetical protein